jgi:hypothetical protein
VGEGYSKHTIILGPKTDYTPNDNLQAGPGSEFRVDGPKGFVVKSKGLELSLEAETTREQEEWILALATLPAFQRTINVSPYSMCSSFSLSFSLWSVAALSREQEEWILALATLPAFQRGTSVSGIW